MLLKHPAMVGQELLETQAHGEDEHKPQHCAEEYSRHHRLALRTHLAGKEERNSDRTDKIK